MKLKWSLVTGEHVDDVMLTAEPGARVGDIAEHLRASHPRLRASVQPGTNLGLRVHGGTSGDRTVGPNVLIEQSGIRSGSWVALTNATDGAAAPGPAAATLLVTSGPDAGKSFPLRSGTSFVGRDRSCDVRFGDPHVSKRHAKIVVSDVVDVIDENSANGTEVDGARVERTTIRSGQAVLMGETEFTVSLHASEAAAASPGELFVQFNRSPRLDPKYQGVELAAPEPPQPPQPQRFPWVSIIAPILMGAILYSVTKNLLSVLFVGLSPIMMFGTYFEGKRSGKKAKAESAEQFRTALRDLALQLQHACEAERVRRREENPSMEQIARGCIEQSQLLWTRRPEHDSFAEIRFGLGARRSRNTVKMPEANRTTPELWRELRDVVGEFATVDRVPVVADLRECGNVGLAGPKANTHRLASAAVAQFCGLHSPAELVLAAVTTTASSERWQWLKWLPHAGSEHSPLGCEHLTLNPPQATALMAALEGLIADREEASRDEKSHPLPLILVVVEDDAAVDRARLVQLAERGPTQGVHFLWVASSLERLPAPCRTFVELAPNAEDGHVGFVNDGEGVEPVELEPLDEETAQHLARTLAGVVDAGSLVDDQSDLPHSVSFLTLAGSELADSPEEVLAYWAGNNSLPMPGGPKLKRDNTLKALVGQSATERLFLDLRTNGPHALVGGTTGAGKSEFLQSWILGLATAHSAARVNFLFVDYKGGSAFADCIDLPHAVGLVTDLNQHLVRRALRSLNAELRRREHILNKKKAKDLLELERRRDPDAPPSLVIVVDEFAALVGEVPEFVDGVVNVAQRGRSLGLHLILATQRPAGVIKDNLRANTNLRVALRMADEDDSTDVVGSAVAGTFDPSIPGRAVAKTGPGRLTSFQSAYVGGHTSDIEEPAAIGVHENPFGLGVAWEPPEPAVEVEEPDSAPADIARIVDNVIAAHEAVGLPEPRRPWLPELSATYRLEDLPTRRTDDELIYGVIDQPDDQSQPVVGFLPDRDGNMAVYGTGGVGKSTFLRSIAVAAGFAPARGGPVHVYALDYGSGGLAMIEELPHVGAVITGDDIERTSRVLKMLRSVIDERATRFSAVNAATISEYRDRSGNENEPRYLLLVDNFAAFRQAYELGRAGNPFSMLESIVADGRSVGVHMVATADQANAFTTSIRSVVQSELALRLASESDMMTLGVPTDVFTEQSPPGRGYQAGADVQVGVLGGDQNVAKQAEAMLKLAEAMRRAGVEETPAIAKLKDQIPFSSIDQVAGQKPVLGVWSESLAPVAFEAEGTFIVSGPPKSGRTSTVVSMLRSLWATNPATEAVLYGPRRSALAGAQRWREHVSGAEEVAASAAALTDQIKQQSPRAANVVVVIERFGEFVGGSADDPLQELLRACRAEGRLVIVEDETDAFKGAWGLVGAAKLDRTGIVLQPNQSDGDLVLGLEFPRVNRTDFPPGRGLYATAGRSYTVQVLSPDG